MNMHAVCFVIVLSVSALSFLSSVLAFVLLSS